MAAIKSLNDFYVSLKTTGVRLKNQFQMTVTGTGIQAVDNALSNLTMYAESATVPGREQQVVELPYMGYPFQIPTTMRMTQEISLTIRSDANMEIRNAFLKWASTVSNPDIIDGSNGEGDKRIPSNSVVRLLMMSDDFSNIVCQYVLYGCFVKNIGTMDLSNANGEVSTFETTIQYQFWRLEDVNAGDVQRTV